MRTGRLIASVFLGSLAALAVTATPTYAAVKIGRLATFGSLVQPNDVAVDQLSGNAFVSDVSTQAVYMFVRKGSAEYEQAAELTGAETPAHAFAFAAGEPAPVAVDSSSGAVYIADIDHHVVDRFGLKGPEEYKYECQITGFRAGCHPNLSGEEGTPEPHFGEAAGVAVDAGGDVYVSDYGNRAVDEFNSADGDIGQITGPLTTEPANLAIDSLGDLYISKFNSSIQKLKIDTATGAIEPGGEDGNFSRGETRAVAVDPATNEVYTDHVSQILRYDSGGVEQPSITSEGMESEGVAVNGTTHEILVSDRGHGDIEVYGSVTIPDTATGIASNVAKTKATMSGNVNPDGAGEAHYFFQYGASEALGLETPEESAGSGSIGELVSAELTGLEPETTYYYRVVAQNANGANEFSKVQKFTTSPAVTMGPCGAPHPPQALSATFCESIDPEGLETSYSFQYGESESLGLETATDVTGTGEVAKEFTVPIAGLQPSVTYYYRVMATNGLGTTMSSPIQAFTTPPAKPTVDDQSPFTTEISPHEATLHGTINPGQGVTSYYFEYGPTAAYGSSAAEVYTQLNYEDDTVEELITGLQPETIYHYALVATNASGTTVGPDEEFTTLESPPAPTEVGVPGGPSLEVTSTPGIVQPGAPALLPTPSFPAIKPLKEPRSVRCKKGFVRKGSRCVRRGKKAAKAKTRRGR